jgi:hypothetical protein
MPAAGVWVDNPKAMTVIRFEQGLRKVDADRFKTAIRPSYRHAEAAALGYSGSRQHNGCNHQYCISYPVFIAHTSLFYFSTLLKEH